MKRSLLAAGAAVVVFVTSSSAQQSAARSQLDGAWTFWRRQSTGNEAALRVQVQSRGDSVIVTAAFATHIGCSSICRSICTTGSGPV